MQPQRDSGGPGSPPPAPLRATAAGNGGEVSTEPQKAKEEHSSFIISKKKNVHIYTAHIDIFKNNYGGL